MQTLKTNYKTRCKNDRHNEESKKSILPIYDRQGKKEKGEIMADIIRILEEIEKESDTETKEFLDDILNEILALA